MNDFLPLPARNGVGHPAATGLALAALLAATLLAPAKSLAFASGPGNCTADEESIAGMSGRPRNAPGEGTFRVSIDIIGQTYTPGTTHLITIDSTDDSVFTGLLLYGETATGERVGTFDKSSEDIGSPTVICPGDPDATAAHAFAGPLEATSVTIPWTAPDEDVGPISFRSIVLSGARGEVFQQEFWFPEALIANPVVDDGADFEINQGIAGAWFDTETPGQGFLLDIEPASGFMFVAWFTWDPASGKVGAPDTRWLTAQGTYEGGTADLIIFETTGGAFDSGQTTTTREAGEMTLRFDSCSEAQVDYTLDQSGLQGSILIQRLVTGTERLCESLAGSR